ncbi:hypothetical protein UY416_12090 [Paenibacillus polymyxa]|uniref:hypothetical protein n=1 Tax=Paenibacillus TaxID=44249 RepID=UPI002AB443BA|nr:hypothetical protein [Paenibacillus polymyxa]MDY8047027.1 hypothetical protein [Paenibacillus polymyxa]
MNTLPARFQEKGTVHVLPREDAAHVRAKAEKLKAFTDGGTLVNEQGLPAMLEDYLHQI